MIIHSGYKRLLPNNVVFLYVRILARYKIEWNRFLSMMAITTPVLSLKSVYARHKQTYTNSTNFLTCMSYTLWLLVCVCVCTKVTQGRIEHVWHTFIKMNIYMEKCRRRRGSVSIQLVCGENMYCESLCLCSVFHWAKNAGKVWVLCKVWR